MSGIWFVLDKQGRIGPFTHEELLETLATFPDRDEVLVKGDGQESWQRVGDVPELAQKKNRRPNFRRSRQLSPNA